MRLRGNKASQLPAVSELCEKLLRGQVNPSSILSYYVQTAIDWLTHIGSIHNMPVLKSGVAAIANDVGRLEEEIENLVRLL